MPIDKSWIHKHRNCPEYDAGIKKFIEKARLHVNEEGKIRCPCVRCYNGKWHKPDLVKLHCMLKGFSKTYQTWYFHGEQFGSNVSDENENEDDDQEREQDEMVEALQDIAGPSGAHTEVGNDDDNPMMSDHGRTDHSKKLDDLFNEVESELYPGCEKFSALTFLVKLMHIKVLNRWTNKSFNMLLELLKEAFPNGTRIPSSHYEAKKKMNELGLGYENIHVCKHDCAIFWKENASLEKCPVCNEPRYQVVGDKGKKIPYKVMRYFPLTPRLKRLYASRHTAEDMRWHYDKRPITDGVLRHPADGEAWKDFDHKYPNFASEPRNVRLGLASDGFNPFGNMSNAYSMWPVILVPYNLPPWKYMKETFFMMSLLIPGPKSPGRDMDIFLRPIVDELKHLWTEGVDVYDAYTKESFRMHVAVLWTINDFPAYSLLSGWSTKGYMACPVCNEQTSSKKLKDKICYMGHRRYLPIDHKWRNSRLHDGSREHGVKPKMLTGEEILMQLEHIAAEKSGKHPNNKHRKRKRAPNELNWYKKSIFFELEYWSSLKLRHNLDVMHIEKNICDNIVGTLLSIEGKTKDTYKAREDLASMGIRRELWLQTQGNRVYKPPASYTFTLDERRQFCKWLKSVKVPDGYSSNISRCINEGDGKISGLKTHDCHVLLQRLLPIGIQPFLQKHESSTLIELSNFFQQLCSRTLYVRDLELLQEQIVVILCKLERMFPPAFFDVMVHLSIHLPYEALLAGPVQSRWMYPFERALGTYKQYVRNKARPEGSIAEAYVVNESLTFCSMYLRGIETRFNRPERNFDSDSHLDKQLNIFATRWRPLGKGRMVHLDDKTLKQVHWYLINNCPEVQPFLNQHIDQLNPTRPEQLNQFQKERFFEWFKNEMLNKHFAGASEATDELYSLAIGPDSRVCSYAGCVVNGVKFITVNRDVGHKTQNSGICVPSTHLGEEINFYGILLEVLEFHFVKGCKAIMFKCKWFETEPKHRRMQQHYNITSINISSEWYKHEPFILASQAEKVFYLDDLKNNSNWKVVYKVSHRHLWDIPKKDDDVQEEVYQEDDSAVLRFTCEQPDMDLITSRRMDTDAEIVAIQENIRGQSDVGQDEFICEDIEEDDTLADYDSEGSIHSSDNLRLCLLAHKCQMCLNLGFWNLSSSLVFVLPY